jgi:hypothetical protein
MGVIFRFLNKIIAPSMVVLLLGIVGATARAGEVDPWWLRWRRLA